jgi:transposase
MHIKQVGIDIGKNSFHLVALGMAGDVVLRRQFTRSRLIAFFEQRAEERLNVAFEACSGAHWLAHQLIALGHDVRLLTPESVRPFAKAQKNDWNDALAIAEAAQRPGRHSVGIKSKEQLDVQALHRVRQRLVTARTAIVNQVRGLLRERGLVFGSGRRQFERFMRERLTSNDERLNPVSRALFSTLAAEYVAIDERVDEIDAELTASSPTRPAGPCFRFPGSASSLPPPCSARSRTSRTFAAVATLLLFWVSFPDKGRPEARRPFSGYRSGAIPMSGHS